MRIAVCYSGEARDIYDTYKNHRDNVYQNHDVDIFIHTWECAEKTITIPFQERGNWHSQIHVYPTEEYIQLFKPNTIKVEKRTTTSQNHRERRIAMFYGIRESYNLIENPSDYDFIVRIRTDAIFNSPIPFESFNSSNTVYIPALPPGFNVGWQPGDWNPVQYCPDFFACGHPNIMKVYAEYAVSTECSTDEECVEWSLCKYLHKQNIQIEKISLICGLHRFY